MANFNRNFLTIVVFFLSTIAFSQNDSPPVVSATGNQIFCQGSKLPIVTSFSLTDPDDTTVPQFNIQISEGYQTGDLLELQGTFNDIEAVWNSNAGKLTLLPTNGATSLQITRVEAAVKMVVFSTSQINISEEKVFSLTIDNPNYLPFTGHFYEFVEELDIRWTDAKVKAENRFFYGRQGYLATLTSKEEADFAGKQAQGNGWIGGSDQETEGTWKWVTGPETGTIFWQGQANGSSPNGGFSFWNTNEPNEFGSGEDYAHITAPGIGLPGSWNDLPNTGGGGAYRARGYIVEYGRPTDPPLSIVASSKIFIPKITSVTENTVCEFGTATLNATSNSDTVLWFDAPTSGNLLHTGNSYTPANISTTTTYYVQANLPGCTTLTRTPVTLTVTQRPQIISTSGSLTCGTSATLQAQASNGSVLWYDTATSTTPIFTGNTFETPLLTSTRSYFVAASATNCSSLNRTEVIAEVNTTAPQFNIVQSNVILCANTGNAFLETSNANDSYTYIWKKNDTIINGNSPSLQVFATGNYTVSAISRAGCMSNEQTLVVNPSETATITASDVSIIDNSNNNSIEIITPSLGVGNYEFTLDNRDGPYTNQRKFTNITPGLHSLFINDKNGCGVTEFMFSVLEYPKFFSPNGDGINDVWQIKGVTSTFYEVSNIYIFNRFGNLLHIVKDNTVGWNGLVNGKKLPPSTYWFKTVLTDVNGFTIEKKGSFSLVGN